MKPFCVIAAAVSLMAAGAWAQTIVQKKIERDVVMGKTIKGAPYSADEISESAQVLADGTHINRQSQVTVYRDGEGRVRRETANEITIWDPVANVSYTLDPATKTARKSPLGRFAVTYDAIGSGAATARVMVMGSGPDVVYRASGGVTANGEPPDPKLAGAALAKMTAEMKAAAGDMVVIDGNPPSQAAAAAAKEQLDLAMTKLTTIERGNLKTESLGKQTLWGVEAEGTRTTSVLDTGAIGNDRPIAVVSERWYSPDLQTVMMTKSSDPRTGEETFRLANVRRGEPGADLFMVPPGYTVK